MPLARAAGPTAPSSAAATRVSTAVFSKRARVEDDFHSRSTALRISRSTVAKPDVHLGVRRRVAGRRIAGDRHGQIEAAPARSAAQCPLDAAMLITQRDLQMDHPLPMAVEAEMAWLDDPGMHRADRDFVDL